VAATTANGANGGGPTNQPVSDSDKSQEPSQSNTNEAITGNGTQGQGSSASLNNQVLGPATLSVVPAASIPDGLQPETFFTYQVLYLPDLTEKYALRVTGGVGEMRATLNMVNGWMFTGPGPVYFHDSSTAETVTAYGTSVSGVLESAASLVRSIYGIPSQGSQGAAAKSANETQSQDKPSTSQLTSIGNYAELLIFEPTLVNDDKAPGGKRMVWKLLTADNPTVGMIRDVVAVGSAGQSSPAPTSNSGDYYPRITKDANTSKPADMAITIFFLFFMTSPFRHRYTIPMSAFSLEY